MADGNVRKPASIRPFARFAGISLRDLAVTAGPLVLITGIAIGAAYWYVRPAPPDTITITSGPVGSTFRLTAEKYRNILARNGVKLEILSSEGSLENLKKLDDIEAKVNNLKMPLAFADQFYVLRDHIRFVRDRYTNRTTE